MLRVVVVVLPLLKLATSISIDVDIDIHPAAADAGTAPAGPAPATIRPEFPGAHCPHPGHVCETHGDCDGGPWCRLPYMECSLDWTPGHKKLDLRKRCIYPSTTKRPTKPLKVCPAPGDDCETDGYCKGYGSVCKLRLPPMECSPITNKCFIRPPTQATPVKPGSTTKKPTKPPKFCPGHGDDCETDGDCNGACMLPHKQCGPDNKCISTIRPPQQTTPVNPESTTKKSKCGVMNDPCETLKDCCPLLFECRAKKCVFHFLPEVTRKPPKPATSEKPACIGVFGACETDSDCCPRDRTGRPMKCSVNKKCFYNFFPGGADESCVKEGEACQADKKCCHCAESEDHVCFCKDGFCCDHNICPRQVGPY